MEDETRRRQRGMTPQQYYCSRIIEIHGSVYEQQIKSVSIICQTYNAEGFVDM